MIHFNQGKATGLNRAISVWNIAAQELQRVRLNQPILPSGFTLSEWTLSFLPRLHWLQQLTAWSRTFPKIRISCKSVCDSSLSGSVISIADSGSQSFLFNSGICLVASGGTCCIAGKYSTRFSLEGQQHWYTSLLKEILSMFTYSEADGLSPCIWNFSCRDYMYSKMLITHKIHKQNTNYHSGL